MPDAKILPIRILDENGEGELWRIKRLLSSCPNMVRTFNLSMGFPEETRVLPMLDCVAIGKTLRHAFPESDRRLGAAVVGTAEPTEIYPAAEQRDGMLFSRSQYQQID